MLCAKLCAQARWWDNCAVRFNSHNLLQLARNSFFPSLEHLLFLLPIPTTLILRRRSTNQFPDLPIICLPTSQFWSIRQTLCTRKVPFCLVDGTLEIGHLFDTCIQSVHAHTFRWDNSDISKFVPWVSRNMRCNINDVISVEYSITREIAIHRLCLPLRLKYFLYSHNKDKHEKLFFQYKFWILLNTYRDF